MRKGVAEALLAFGTQGSRRALELAKETLGFARTEVARLVTASQSREPRTVFAILRDLDISLLESAVFANLLALDLRAADQGAAPAPVEELRDQLGSLFVGWEASAPVPMGGKKVPLANIRMRRLKAFIHLLDVDGEQASESSARGGAVRSRWLRASHTVLRRLSSDPPSVFDRSLVAALARALDGLVRAEMCDAVDALLFVAHRLQGPAHFATLKEAAKHTDLAALFERYERYARAEIEAKKPLVEKPFVDEASPSLPLPFSPLSIPARSDATAEPKDELSRRVAALSDFAHDLSGENSSREEALRAVLVRLVRGLEKIARASSLGELLSSAPGVESTFALLEEAIGALGQMVTAARLRLAEGELGDARGAVHGREYLGAAPARRGVGHRRAGPRVRRGFGRDSGKPGPDASESARGAHREHAPAGAQAPGRDPRTGYHGGGRESASFVDPSAPDVGRVLRPAIARQGRRRLGVRRQTHRGTQRPAGGVVRPQGARI